MELVLITETTEDMELVVATKRNTEVVELLAIVVITTSSGLQHQVHTACGGSSRCLQLWL